MEVVFVGVHDRFLKREECLFHQMSPYHKKNKYFTFIKCTSECKHRWEREKTHPNPEIR